MEDNIMERRIEREFIGSSEPNYNLKYYNGVPLQKCGCIIKGYSNPIALIYPRSFLMPVLIDVPIFV